MKTNCGGRWASRRLVLSRAFWHGDEKVRDDARAVLEELQHLLQHADKGFLIERGEDLGTRIAWLDHDQEAILIGS
jgi:hypothetical protein